MSQEFLRYKGRPLVRSGDTLYYGSMGDKCVAHLQIKSNKQDHGLNMADKVVIQLISTDETLPLKDRMLNKAERDDCTKRCPSQASGWTATIKKNSKVFLYRQFPLCYGQGNSISFR